MRDALQTRDREARARQAMASFNLRGPLGSHQMKVDTKGGHMVHKWIEGTRAFEVEVDRAGNAKIRGEGWTPETLAREIASLVGQLENELEVGEITAAALASDAADLETAQQQLGHLDSRPVL